MPTVNSKDLKDAASQEHSYEDAPEIERETRFAVVMYGGVSLAIYIYGVAKELYSMVRATARSKKNLNDKQYAVAERQLTEVEKVYRRVGEALGTKFVMDILSGTSAGGINAIYLAKALANGQSVERLKGVWLEEGDIGKLINDKDSVIPGLELQDPPTSLLNSQRMYYHLLRALHEMDVQGSDVIAKGDPSPFVEELDLNITATDLRGLEVDLPVTNAYVQEFRYRNVFRFHYSTMDAAGREVEGDSDEPYSNDFVQENNPFLAYVARCTSSFPVAFEPMQLDDVMGVLKLKRFGDYAKLKPENWRNYYKDYEKIDQPFATRAFGDGGYIDNKPFSYATEALLRRRADTPVDRKLIYIDPSPEHPDVTPNKKGQRPDALQNVLAALLSIPRYEPIREDLEKVIERNRLIKRVNEVISHIDFVPALKKELKAWQKDTTGWANKYFDDELLGWFGVSYATYHQLRVADVLKNFESAILRGSNWEETGIEAQDLHVLIEGWRRAFYSIKPQESATHMSENDILFRLDTTWRMRRIVFLQNVINKLLKALSLRDEKSAVDPKKRDEAISQANQLLLESGIENDISNFDPDELRTELIDIKRELNDAYGYLRARGRKVRSRKLVEKTGLDEELQNYVVELSKLKKNLEKLAGSQSTLKELADGLRRGDAPSAELSKVFEQIEKTSTALAEHLPNEGKKGYIHKTLSLVSGKVKNALGNRPRGAKGKDNRSAIQKCLSFYHDRFEYYDMLIFPIYYGTDVGESDETEIIRVSPQDADSLVDEKQPGKRKLAGTTLMNFGAFFEGEWRENDMLWGRLDAAECVIKAMMPEGDPRKNFLHDLQIAILQEDLTSRDEAKVYEKKTAAEKTEKEKLENKYKSQFRLNEKESQSLKMVLERLSQPDKMLELFKDKYAVDRKFPPQQTLMASSRALRVFSNLLEGLSKQHKQFSAPAKWLTSAGSIFSGIVAVALPNSIGNFLFAGYWIWLLYIFELLLAGVGWVLGATGISQLGIALFVLTFLSHLMLRAVNDSLAGRPGWLRLLLLVLAGVLGIGALGFVVLLVYIGLLDLSIVTLPAGSFGDWIQTLINSK